jgi:hypothetical protein
MMSDKIVHFVLDDGLYTRKGFDWENYQEQSRWEKFIAWNNATNMFQDDDILIFGDADEIPSREIYQHFRYLLAPTDIGTWFTNSDVRTEFWNDSVGFANCFYVEAGTGEQNISDSDTWESKPGGAGRNSPHLLRIFTCFCVEMVGNDVNRQGKDFRAGFKQLLRG